MAAWFWFECEMQAAYLWLRWEHRWLQALLLFCIRRRVAAERRGR